MKDKVMAAMSGGVDSAVAAALLLAQGYDIVGITLKLFENEDIGVCRSAKACCTAQDAADARAVADRIGFPHYVFNLRDEFQHEVISRFVEGYQKGITPNPCIDCNRYIKFNALFRRAETIGFDYIATGHYAKIAYDNAAARYLLQKAADSKKDQTYVLYALTQHQLAKTLFPLGGLLKSTVREIAAKHGFVNAAKPDSQDICFVPNGSYADFIENYTGQRMSEGDFIGENGSVIGRHRGHMRYTIGQRKGLGLSLDRPLYVSAKDAAKNTVTLAPQESLYSHRATAGDLNWIAVDKLTAPLPITCKTRYRQEEAAAVLHPLDENRVLIEFKLPQRAITSGQAAVFYDKETVVGGGTLL